MKNKHTPIKKFNEFYEYNNVEEHTPDPIDQEYTGLSMMVWLYTNGNKGKLPIVKVQNTYTTEIDSNIRFTVIISSQPKIINGIKGEISDDDLCKVFNWIIKNEKILIDMWNGKIDDDVFFDKMIKSNS
jgi:hypothetical protein